MKWFDWIPFRITIRKECKMETQDLKDIRGYLNLVHEHYRIRVKKLTMEGGMHARQRARKNLTRVKELMAKLEEHA